MDSDRAQEEGRRGGLSSPVWESHAPFWAGGGCLPRRPVPAKTLARASRPRAAGQKAVLCPHFRETVTGPESRGKQADRLSGGFSCRKPIPVAALAGSSEAKGTQVWPVLPSPQRRGTQAPRLWGRSSYAGGGQGIWLTSPPLPSLLWRRWADGTVSTPSFLLLSQPPIQGQDQLRDFEGRGEKSARSLAQVQGTRSEHPPGFCPPSSSAKLQTGGGALGVGEGLRPSLPAQPRV